MMTETRMIAHQVGLLLCTWPIWVGSPESQMVPETAKSDLLVQSEE